MRKEAIIAICATLVSLVAIASMDVIFNAIAGFFLSGLIPGTQIAIPSILMFGVTILALSVLMIQPLRKFLPRKYTIKTVRGKFLQIKV